MVKKLFKYEFLAYIRVLFPVYIAMLGVSVLGRILMIFENDTTSSDLLIGSSIFMYGATVLVAFGFVGIYAITRFQKNMFSGEGYLTLTLPATAAQHIWSKLLAAMLFSLFSLIAFVVSFCIITAGDVLKEVFNAFVYLVKDLVFSKYVFYIVEAVLSVVLGLASSILLFYTCISIGQLFKKNRTFGAVVAYFGYSFVVQILSSVALALLVESPYIGDVIEFIIQRNYIISGIMAVAFFFITRHIITNKLNLE